ncbi:MAG: GGDEF domain-containing protein [Brevinematia bacterium]
MEMLEMDMLCVKGFEDCEEEQLIRDLIFNKGYDLDKVFEALPEKKDGKFFSKLIYYLSTIELSEEEAEKAYQNIIEHKRFLSEKLAREVPLRVASLDYFFNITGILKNPKFIELELFERMVKQTREDPKTGCYNARFLSEMVNKEINRSLRYGLSFSLILIDIDNFKAINDTYGHLFGDKILIDFSNAIHQSIRREDIAARYGGDEFAVVLPHTGRLGARFVAERIKENFQNIFSKDEYRKKGVVVSFSAGIATYPRDAEDYESMIEVADKALYQSKLSGKNTIISYGEKEDSSFSFI